MRKIFEKFTVPNEYLVEAPTALTVDAEMPAIICKMNATNIKAFIEHKATAYFIKCTGKLPKPPFKVYVYGGGKDCTQNGCTLTANMCCTPTYEIHRTDRETKVPVGTTLLNGNIIGEFLCEETVPGNVALYKYAHKVYQETNGGAVIDVTETCACPVIQTPNAKHHEVIIKGVIGVLTNFKFYKKVLNDAEFATLYADYSTKLLNHRQAAVLTNAVGRIAANDVVSGATSGTDVVDTTHSLSDAIDVDTESTVTICENKTSNVCTTLCEQETAKTKSLIAPITETNDTNSADAYANVETEIDTQAVLQLATKLSKAFTSYDLKMSLTDTVATAKQLYLRNVRCKMV